MGMVKDGSHKALLLEGRVASSMLRELMRPQNPVLVNLINPVFVHVRQQVKLAIRRKPRVNGFALVSGDRSSIFRLVG